MIHHLVRHVRWRIGQRERDRRNAGRKGFLPMSTTTETITITREDEQCALWFTPGCIRDHYDGDDSDIGEAVRAATDEQLRAIGDTALCDDGLYSAFHSAIEWAARDTLDIEDA